MRSRFAVISEASRLAVAAPAWTEAMTARREKSPMGSVEIIKAV
jgi:hypothetical protein